MMKELNSTRTENCRTEAHSAKMDNDNNLELLFSIHPEKINYSMNESAKLLGVSYDFVREAIHNGKISATKFGDRYLIHVNELARILTEGV